MLCYNIDLKKGGFKMLVLEWIYCAAWLIILALVWGNKEDHDTGDFLGMGGFTLSWFLCGHFIFGF